MKNSVISKLNLFELKLYKLLGIRQFKKLILKFEEFKNKKSGHKNANYHLNNFTGASMKKYTGFLIYNALIHIVSIVFFVLYFVFSELHSVAYIVADISSVCFIVLNVYCIMLQRYIYLKIKLIRNKKAEKIYVKNTYAVEVNRSSNPFILSEKGKNDVLDLLNRIEKCFLSDGILILDTVDAESLKTILNITGEKNVTPSGYKKALKSPYAEASFGAMLTDCMKSAKLYAPSQQRVDRMNRLFKRDECGSVIDCPCIITVDAECEELFEKIFGKVSADEVYIMIEIIRSVCMAN